MIVMHRTVEMVLCPDRHAADMGMLKLALPPAAGTRRSLVVCRTWPRSRMLWNDVAATLLPDQCCAERNEMRWGDRVVRFGSVEHDGDVFRYAGYETDLLCICGLSDFRQFDICYLLSFNRSSSDFAARAYATP